MEWVLNNDIRDADSTVKRCYIVTSFLPARGHIIITPQYICFWRRVAVGTDIRVSMIVRNSLLTRSVSLPGWRRGKCIHCSRNTGPLPRACSADKRTWRSSLRILETLVKGWSEWFLGQQAGDRRTDDCERLWHISNHWLEQVQALQLSVQNHHQPERQTVESRLWQFPPSKLLQYTPPISLPPQKALYFNHCLWQMIAYRTCRLLPIVQILPHA